MQTIKTHHSHILTTICYLMLFFIIFTSFSNLEVNQTKGSIEGYLYPKEAKARVVIAVPHPNKEGDTIQISAIPNTAGFFKLNNVPAGPQRVVYYPSNPSLFKSASAVVIVTAGQTTNAGSITLGKQ